LKKLDTGNLQNLPALSKTVPALPWDVQKVVFKQDLIVNLNKQLIFQKF